MPYVFTVFCTEADRPTEPTTWIEAVEVEKDDAVAAGLAGRQACADAWDVSPGEVAVIGVARGNVEVCLWDDSGL